jgi:hypothetical protein
LSKIKVKDMAKKKQKIRTESDLIKVFKLRKIIEKFPLLDSWLNVERVQLPVKEDEWLEELRLELKAKIDFWNEEEVKMNFISLLLNYFVRYKSPLYETYFDKEIFATVEDNFLKTEADFMIAKGIGEIAENPYFCFHVGGTPQYKRTKKNPSDPIAQVLEAMLIAQELNKNEKPIYGLYTISRNWYFMVMQGRTYSISKGFEASEKDDLLLIIAILRKFKVILETELLD